MTTTLDGSASSALLPKSEFRSKFSAIREEDEMDAILTELTTTISEFKKNPNEVVKRAKNKPLAVLTNNKATFYVLSAKAYDDLLEKIWELEITPVVLERIANLDKAKRVTLEELRNM